MLQKKKNTQRRAKADPGKSGAASAAAERLLTDFSRRVSVISVSWAAVCGASMLKDVF